MKLTGNYEITHINGKIGAKALKGVKVGDIITIEFDVDGNGGNSPRVDVDINGTYAYSPFARQINEMFEGKSDYVYEAKRWVKMRPLFSYKEVTK